MDHFVTVRYGKLRELANFQTKITDLHCNDDVIIKTDRDIEFGTIVDCIEKSKGSNNSPLAGAVLRKADTTDRESQNTIEEEIIPKEHKYCRKKIKEFNIPMKLIALEHLFGKKKVIIYYIASRRIDFRELVKDLASEFLARIEMKQIGVRDEARLLADYQHCGRELCCRTFLKNLDPVAMKMAKRQKATMDPAKISGRCGKLMCCLRYEDEVYEELKNNLPKKGSIVNTEKGDGEVIDIEILAQNVLIENEEGKRLSVSLKEITGIKNRTNQAKPKKQGRCSSSCKK